MRWTGTKERRGDGAPVVEEPGAATVTPLWERARAAVRGSAWSPLAGKAAAYAAGFCALALVGSGDALRLLPRFGGGAGAEAALVVQGPRAPGEGAASAPGEAAPPGPHAGIAEGADAGAGDGGTAAADADADAAASGAAAGGGVTADGKVVLNLATAEDLQRLPGVGPAKAARILAARAKLKRFRKVEDLLLVKGIGRRSLKRLRDLVVVDPPKP